MKARRFLTASAVALVLASSGAAIFHLSGPFAAAWVARDEAADPRVYERALQWDPDNADYHFHAAEIYRLSARYPDSRRALAHYEAAVRGNPRRSAHWLGLASLLESRGDGDGARRALGHAIETDPRYARTWWTAANLYLRLGDLGAADDALARTVSLDETFFPQVLDLAWRFYRDPGRILAEDVPDTKEGNRAALGYFIREDSEDGARLAWERLARFQITPRERLAYVDYLIGLGEPEAAYRAFVSDAAPSSETGQSASADLIYNGSFESELLNGGFGWRFPTQGPVTVRRDTTRPDDGRASLLIEFDGAENPAFSAVWHWLAVEAGRPYELAFSIRTDSLSTNEGIYLEVDGVKSDALTGTNPWQRRTIRFVASSDLVRLRVRRDPTRKLDNILNGRVWLDGFGLTGSD